MEKYAYSMIELFLSYLPKKGMRIHKKTCTWMFIAAVLLMAPSRNIQKTGIWVESLNKRPWNIYRFNKQEWTIDTCYGSAEAQDSYAGWKKPDVKQYILVYFIL